MAPEEMMRAAGMTADEVLGCADEKHAQQREHQYHARHIREK